MKKFICALSVMVFSSMMAHAQDIVTLKNGEDVLAKVLEVGTREVKYTLFEEPDGPVYIVNKSDILIIRYESGRNEIFNKTLPGPNREDSVEIVPGMKYRQLKHIYNYREYVPSLTDRYSPGWSGVASFFVPGLGECINGEWGRGLAVVGGNFLLHLIMFNAAEYGGSGAYYGQYDNDSAIILAWAGLAGIVTLDIWSTVDAVRIAKVKNMYEQDLRRSYYSLDMKVYPSVNQTFNGTALQPAPGLTLALRF